MEEFKNMFLWDYYKSRIAFLAKVFKEYFVKGNMKKRKTIIINDPKQDISNVLRYQGVWKDSIWVEKEWIARTLIISISLSILMAPLWFLTSYFPEIIYPIMLIVQIIIIIITIPIIGYIIYITFFNKKQKKKLSKKQKKKFKKILKEMESF